MGKWGFVLKTEFIIHRFRLHQSINEELASCLAKIHLLLLTITETNVKFVSQKNKIADTQKYRLFIS